MLIVEVPVQRLSADQFAPFGQIIGERAERPVLIGPAIRSWRIPLDMDGAAELVVVRFEHRPFEPVLRRPGRRPLDHGRGGTHRSH